MIKRIIKCFICFAIACVIAFFSACGSRTDPAVPALEKSENEKIMTEELAGKIEELVRGNLISADKDIEPTPCGEFTLLDEDSDGFPDLMFLGEYKRAGNLYSVSTDGMKLLNTEIRGQSLKLVDIDGRKHIMTRQPAAGTGIISYGDYILSEDYAEVLECTVYVGSFSPVDEMSGYYTMTDYESFTGGDNIEIEISEEMYKDIENEYKYSCEDLSHPVTDFTVARYIYEAYGLEYSLSSDELYRDDLLAYVSGENVKEDFVGCLADMNNDGYMDLIYTDGCYPCTYVFDASTGYFDFEKYGEDIITGPSFPDNSDGSDFWFDGNKGIIVIKVTGDSIDYMKAAAYKTGRPVSEQWTLCADETEKNIKSRDKFEKKFESATSIYSLTDFYEVAVPVYELVKGMS